MMMSKHSKILSLIFLMTSVIVGISSSSFMAIWLSLEANLLSFLGLCWSTENAKWESVPKYFIIQAIGSAILLFNLITMGTSHWFLINVLFGLALLLKLGAFPFYSWFLALSKVFNKEVLFLFLTLQKVIPLYLFSFVKINFTLILILNAIVSASLTLKVFSLNMVLALSSMFSLSWMLGASKNFLAVLIFLIFYSLVLWPVTKNMFSMFFFSSSKYAKMNLSSSLSFCLSMFALLGLPPSAGFFIKLMMISSMNFYYSLTLSFFLLMCSSSFIYVYSSLMVESMSLSKNFAMAALSLKSIDWFILLIVWSTPMFVIMF